jgi:hypothetical protein
MWSLSTKLNAMESLNEGLIIEKIIAEGLGASYTQIGAIGGGFATGR